MVLKAKLFLRYLRKKQASTAQVLFVLLSVHVSDVAHLSEILAQDGELFEGIGYSGILYGTHHQVGHHREQLLLANNINEN
jgi:hypothetical protein